MPIDIFRKPCYNLLRCKRREYLSGCSTEGSPCQRGGLRYSSSQAPVGRLLPQQGDKKTAMRHWRRARDLDGGNYIIRKQIWAVEHPDKFYPTVDYGWQGQQTD